MTLRANAIMQEAVSARAKAAIGHEATSLDMAIGEPADFVLFDRVDAGWRCRKTISEVLYDPGAARQTIRHGKLTTY